MEVKTYKCPSCGASIDANTGICNYCGTKVEIAKKTFDLETIGKKVNDFFDTSTTDTKIKKEKENKITMLIVGIILLFIVPPVGILLIILAILKKSN